MKGGDDGNVCIRRKRTEKGKLQVDVLERKKSTKVRTACQVPTDEVSSARSPNAWVVNIIDCGLTVVIYRGRVYRL